MVIYRWICPGCKSAYILPRQSKHQYNHWRCYSCKKVFHEPMEVGTMGMDDSFYAPLTMTSKPRNWTEIVAGYHGPYRFPDSMMMYDERPREAPPKSSPTPKKKRFRATVIAEQKDRVLLIRERGARSYSLPGGGIEGSETVMRAALRELQEETKLSVIKADRLFDHEGTTQHHKVVWAQVRGNVQIQRKELSNYKWWDMREPVRLLDSARAILNRYSKDRQFRDSFRP